MIVHHIKLYAHVVSYPLIQEKCEEVVMGPLADGSTDLDLSEKILHGAVEKKQIVE